MPSRIRSKNTMPAISFLGICDSFSSMVVIAIKHVTLPYASTCVLTTIFVSFVLKKVVFNKPVKANEYTSWFNVKKATCTVLGPRSIFTNIRFAVFEQKSCVDFFFGDGGVHYGKKQLPAGMSWDYIEYYCYVMIFAETGQRWHELDIW